MDTHNWQDAAASALANSGADGAEVGSVGGSGWRKTAVKVGKTEDIGSTALRGGVEAGARSVRHLALLNGDGHDGGSEGENGNGELHFG